MGLLEDTGEYREVSSGGDPELVLDPHRGFILGERHDRPTSSSWSPFYEIRRAYPIDVPEEPLVPVETSRWRWVGTFAGNLLTGMVESRVIVRLERALFK